MTFSRATKGNEVGKEQVQKANDKLEQKIILMPKSMKIALKKKAFMESRSESEIVRSAIQGVL